MAYPEDFDQLLVSDRAQFARLTPKVRTAYRVHAREAEVNNGGFHQFFLNQSPTSPKL
jgi:Domain of unknown function (DUF4375)